MTRELAFMSGAAVVAAPFFYEVWPGVLAGFGLCALLMLVSGRRTA